MPKTAIPWHWLKAITVENRAPDEADMRRLLHRAGGDYSKVQPVVRHVTLHLHGKLPAQSAAHHLWIGSSHVSQYFGVPGGLAFKVDDAAELATLYRQPVQFVSNSGQELPTGMLFPDLMQHLSAVVGHRWRKLSRG
jgi:hypothetical protein